MGRARNHILCSLHAAQYSPSKDHISSFLFGISGDKDHLLKLMLSSKKQRKQVEKTKKPKQQPKEGNYSHYMKVVVLKIISLAVPPPKDGFCDWSKSTEKQGLTLLYMHHHIRTYFFIRN